MCNSLPRIPARCYCQRPAAVDFEASPLRFVSPDDYSSSVLALLSERSTVVYIGVHRRNQKETRRHGAFKRETKADFISVGMR